MAEDQGGSTNVAETEKNETSSRKRQGLLSRLWRRFFRQSDDFEKRLQNISKEEAVVLARLKKRSLSWRRMTRNLIIFSVIFEAIAVGYAIMTTRTLDMDWKMRAFRVLPMFVLPALSSATYSALVGFTKMCDRKDLKTLERLRAERQAKIDELKERTNYYSTQQLIQRYDTDPAAKAAAATVLASKLGADSGLQVYLRDELKGNVVSGKSNDVELVQPDGLRNRKQCNRPNSMVANPLIEQKPAGEGPESPRHSQLVVDHYSPQGQVSYEGGWLGRLAALLVGEDPTQSYALICGHCRMHNGLARKEDFPYITYYCPHCQALNRAKQSEEIISASSESISATAATDMISSPRKGVASESVSNSPSKSDPEVEQVPGKVVAGDS